MTNGEPRTHDAIACSHLIDDIATDAAKLRRQRDDAVELLHTALDALRGGATHVVYEYIDRAVARLSNAP